MRNIASPLTALSALSRGALPRLFVSGRHMREAHRYAFRAVRLAHALPLLRRLQQQPCRYRGSCDSSLATIAALVSPRFSRCDYRVRLLLLPLLLLLLLLLLPLLLLLLSLRRQPPGRYRGSCDSSLAARQRQT